MGVFSAYAYIQFAIITSMRKMATFEVRQPTDTNQNGNDVTSNRVGDTRDRIQSWIEVNPGIHLRELQRSIGCSMGSIQYHLIQLEAQGEVRSLMNGKTKHLFSPEFSTDEQFLQFTALVRNPTVRMILNICLKGEATTQAELSRIMDTDVSVVSYYISQMLEAKVLKIIPVFGREKPLMLTDWAMDCIHSQ